MNNRRKFLIAGAGIGIGSACAQSLFQPHKERQKIVLVGTGMDLNQTAKILEISRARDLDIQFVTSPISTTYTLEGRVNEIINVKLTENKSYFQPPKSRKERRAEARKKK